MKKMAFSFRSKFINADDRGVTKKCLVSINAILAVLFITALILLPPVNAVNTGDPVKGQAVFTKNSCSICHPGGDNTMDPGHPIKGPAFQQKYKDDQVLEQTIRKGFPQYGMPSFTPALVNEREMKDLIAYVRTLSKIAKPSK